MNARVTTSLALGTALALWGCQPSAPATPDGAGDAAAVDVAAVDAFVPPPFFDARPLPAEPQRPGDPAAGYLALVNNGYVSCGVPWSAFSQVSAPVPVAQRLPGREGHNATLPYNLTAFRTASGVEVVSANCLSCHAGGLNGRLMIGLGNADGDFTRDTASLANLAGSLVTDPAERVEYTRWAERVRVVAPYIRMPTIGPNPADNIAAILFAHRDRHTLEWSNAPLLEPPPRAVVPVDVPPWWRMARRNAMFYNGSGRGDHARIMMTASTLCTDSVAEAQAIDAYFNDIRAYITSLRPPAYPYPIDQALAARGQQVFANTCARCHGTYGAGGVYPNLLVSLGEVSTDATLATGTTQFAGRFVQWFNESFYGQTARLEPQQGYVAPPLDGVWATAPFLHNGSVPTLAALLESATRPRFWTRSHDSRDYDPATVGWIYTPVDHGQADEPDTETRIRIYDTTMPGYGNAGHTFGDGLSADDRAAVIEYVKTL